MRLSVFLLIYLFATVFQTGGMEKNILFNRLDVNDGLPSNEVSGVFKDRKGFIWFSTGAGLTRFDGYEFRTFRHEINGSLFSEEYIIRMTETMDGNLWTTYGDGKISVYNPQKNIFRTVEEASSLLSVNKHITDIFHDNDRQLLFGTDSNELCRFDFTGGQITAYAVDRSKGRVCDAGQRGNMLYVIHSSGTVEIIDVLQNKCIFSDDYMSAYPQPKRFNLFIDSSGELWIYMNPENHNGLFRLSPKTKRWTHYTTGTDVALTSSLIRAVEEDSNGIIWIAADHGGINLLNRKDNSINYLKNKPFDPKSISQNSVICLYKDNTGIIWCGTYKNGVNYYNESIFKFDNIRYPVDEAEDADINDCNCVYEDSAGNLWIGTNGNGLLCYNRSTRQYRRYRHNPAVPSSISSNIIICLTGDGKGNLWIGTYMGGLDCFDGKSFVHHRPDEGESKKLTGGSIYSLYADGKDNLWIGTLGGGLNCFDLKTKEWTHFNAADKINPLLSDNIYSISMGKGSQLLIGTALGVNMLDTRTDRISTFNGTVDGKETFRGKAINSVHMDSKGLMWIGSNNGLDIYDSVNDRLYHPDNTTALSGNGVMSIMEDSAGVLWLGTKNGLLKASASFNGNDSTYQFSCTAYYENEGIQGRIFNRNSVCLTRKGELIFGSTDGLTVFNPPYIKHNSYPPQVVFTGFSLQNDLILPGRNYNGRIILQNDISYAGEISLKYGERNFTVTISALNYFLPKKTRFYYRMEGFDRQWTTADAANRSVTYTNLPPGNYTFIARAENNDGVFSAENATLRLTVLPPFWLTSWAISFYSLAVILISWLTVKLIVRIQKKKFAKEQERIAANRLHEMDEMKLRFFTNVSHEFRTPLTLIIAPLEKLMKGENSPANKTMLKLIYENANQLLTLVNQLLDFRKIDVQGASLLLSSGDIVLFVRNIVYSFRDISEHKNIRFSYSSAAPSFIMSFDTDKVFKIISNLLSNAFKFTPEGGEISVTLHLNLSERADSHLLIQVADTGIGIASDQCEQIFNRFYQVPSEDKTNTVAGTGIGLHICREFARMHSGTVTVKSELGKGSVFTLSLPVNLTGIQEIISSSQTAGEKDSVVESVEEIRNTELPLLLIVDDNANFRQFMQQSLSDTYDILTAADGEQAWQLILEKMPDMVVSDVMMPLTDGIELCRRIKNDIRTSHIPVILLTAKSAEANKLTGLEAGADDYIGKPFNIDILFLKIRHLVELRARMQKQFQQSSQSSIRLTDINISSLDEELMRKSISFIEEHIANAELSVEWLSRSMGMSRSIYYKKVMSITGKSPIELIRTIRLKQAAQLLEKSNMRVNEVASMVGFNDSKLFRKYFKEEFGVLPSSYADTRK